MARMDARGSPQIVGGITPFQDSRSIVLSDAGTILDFLHHRLARLKKGRSTSLDLSSRLASQHQLISPGFASADHHVWSIDRHPRLAEGQSDSGLHPVNGHNGVLRNAVNRGRLLSTL
jgi:hypothetical protein